MDALSIARSVALFLTHRIGRRNFYEVHPHLPLRHEMDDYEIGDILAALTERRSREEAAKSVASKAA